MWLPTLALLLGAQGSILCSEMWGFHFVNQNLTWSEAQQFCRQHFQDLACVSSSGDNGRLPRPPGYSAPVWIGLYDHPRNLSLWKWATGSSPSFHNWEEDEPRYVHDPQQCAVFANGWYTASTCTDFYAPLCHSELALTWRAALIVCRTRYTDLAVIETQQENDAAWEVVKDQPNARAWMGLVRTSGLWSDNRTVTFTAWNHLYGLKDYTQPFCAVENKINSWDVTSCQERHPFYCQEKPTRQKVVKMKFSGHGLDDPEMQQLLALEIQKRFGAAGHPDVKIKWKTAPKKQEPEKEEGKPEHCHDL